MKLSLFGKIQSQWDNIVQNLDGKRVCDVLMTTFTLLPNELQRINSHVTYDDQARQLLEILKVKDDQHFKNFLSALDRTDHKYIADAIRKAKVPREYVEPVACSGPTASTSSSSNITRIPHNGPINTISSLRPSQKGWIICDRVTNKNTVSKYKKYGGWNQRFSVSFADDSGSIEAVAFGEAVNKFYELLEVQKVYYISGDTIKKANSKFSQGNAYVMVLENDMNIELCDDEDNLDLPTEISYNSVGIDKLEPGRLCARVKKMKGEATNAKRQIANKSKRKRKAHVKVTSVKKKSISMDPDTTRVKKMKGEATNAKSQIANKSKRKHKAHVKVTSVKKKSISMDPDTTRVKKMKGEATNAKRQIANKSKRKRKAHVKVTSVKKKSISMDPDTTSGGATASSSSDGPVDYISSLRPYQKRWKICSRITNKSRITFHRKSGKRFDKRLSLTFTDASGSINAVAFGQTVDKFNGLLKERKVYYVSNATIKQNEMFMGENAYDMILTDDTNIKLCKEEDSLALPTQIPFKSTMIDELEPGQLYDVVGVVKDHREKTVKKWHGIDVQIVDQSKKMVSLNLSKKDVEKLDLHGNPVLAVNGACLKRSYGHVYLKMMPNSKLQVNPADIPETDLLKRWFEKEGRQIEFEKI